MILAEARLLLTAWKQQDTPAFNAAELNVEEVARIAIEEALVASHRHVFGVFFWFVVLPGPSGAVLYRAADFVARSWNRAPEEAWRCRAERNISRIAGRKILAAYAATPALLEYAGHDGAGKR